MFLSQQMLLHVELILMELPMLLITSALKMKKTYVHRIGRTARAGAHGIAVTFVDWDELARWKMIDQTLELGLAEPEETYSSSEHLYEMLNIPAWINGPHG
jgi:superfamily II DNA/RNA helicase